MTDVDCQAHFAVGSPTVPLIRLQMLRDLKAGLAGHLGSLCEEASSDIFVTGRNSRSSQNTRNELGINWWKGETEGNWRTGQLMMAYLTGNASSVREAQLFVRRIIESQDATGYLGIFAPEQRFRSQGYLWTQACLMRDCSRDCKRKLTR